MSLPKIQHPILSFKLPNNKSYNFRPFLVKEEKLLLMVKETRDDQDIFKTLIQIVNNCSLDKNFEADNLTMAELGFLFLQLRASSVNNKIIQVYIDHEDNKEYKIEIDLNNITIAQKEELPNTIKINKTTGVVLRHPPASVFAYYPDDNPLYLISKCIDKIFDEDEVFVAKDCSSDELYEFIENLPVSTFETITKYLNNEPTLYYEAKYKNSLSHERKIVLGSVQDFFSFH